MVEKKKSVLKEWLQIELNKTAYKMGFVENIPSVSEELIMDTIRCIDHESLMEKTPSVNYIITVVGLMWEHIDHDKYDLKK